MYGVVHHTISRADASIIEGFREIWTSTASDSMGRHGAMSSEIRPITAGLRFVGSAFTVQNYPNDNLTTHKALLMAEPGDVLVIDEGPGNSTGSFGHNMSLQATARGVIALVSNGCMRDLALLRRDGFCAFCRGFSPRSAQKSTPGSVNVPVSVGGLVVRPGDIVIGDDDGVAVIPLDDAERVLEIARKRMQMEFTQADNIRKGEKPLEIVHGENWVDKAIAGKMREFH